MANTYSSTPVLSKVKIGEKVYYLKDADVRAIIDGYNNDIVTGTIGTVEANSDAFVRAKDIKTYVDNLVSVGLVVEVVSELPTAAANEMGKLFLVADKHSDTDLYDEFVVIRSGEADAYVYSWEKIGNTDIDLSNYYTKKEVDAKIDELAKTLTLTDQTVKMTEDFTATVNIGTFTVPASGSGTISAKGKTLNEFLKGLLASAKDPKVDQPWVSIRLNEAGAKEVGTSIVPSYSVTFNPGNYQYGPATGITATYAVSDTAENTSTAKEGNFTVEEGNYQFTVTDDTNYKVSVTATHTAGVSPKNNLGELKDSLAIKAGTKSSTSSAVTGFRNSFWGGVKSKEGTPTSAVIRGLAGKKGGSISAGNTGDAAESVGDMRVIIAVPAPRTITSIKDVNGLNAEAFSAFTHITVDVEGANGYTAKSYNVYYKDNAAACDKANKWHFTVA